MGHLQSSKSGNDCSLLSFQVFDAERACHATFDLDHCVGHTLPETISDSGY